MRYDLEFNIVDKLTQDKVDYAATVLYGNNNIIEPLKWDEKVLNDSLAMNVGGIDNSYSVISDIDGSLYSSGISSSDPVELDSYIIKDNTITPIFNSGTLYAHNNKFSWSKHTISKEFTVNASGYYECEIDSDFIRDTIDIFTLKLTSTTFVSRAREYSYVEYDDISLKTTFESSNYDNSYTIISNKVYLNKVTRYSCLLPVKKADGTINRIFGLPEFPVSNLSISSSIDSDYCKVQSGAFIIGYLADLSGITDDLSISYTVAPIITYKQSSRYEYDDIVFRNTNMSPTVLGFKSGLICARLKASDKGFSSIPSSLTIKSDSEYVTSTSSALITANLYGTDGLPISSSTVNFRINSGEGVQWYGNTDESNPETMSILTSAAGKADATLSMPLSNIGHFINKEWMSYNGGTNKTTITLPFQQQPLIASGTTYLYFVLDDDPILGRLVPTDKDLSMYQYYKSESLSSYYQTGRRLAYTTYSVSGGKIYSRYIKPTMITEEASGTIQFRNLYINNSKHSYDPNYTMRTIYPDATYVTTLNPSGSYKEGIYPDNKIDIYQTTINNITKITFDGQITLGSNVAGFWLVTDTAGEVEVQAFCNDGFVNIESETIKLKIKPNIQSETEFFVVGYPLASASGINTQVGYLGYLTLTEVTNNLFGLNPSTECCAYTDPVKNECSKNYDGFYSPSNGLCNNAACPYKNTIKVNPFLP